MIRAIVVEDEPYSLAEICDLTEETGEFLVAGYYLNPLDAVRDLDATQPQAAFLDIELPELDGLTLAERLLEIDPSINIVFLTSYGQYAVQAFELNAVDYLLKPIRQERFRQMLDRVRRNIGGQAGTGKQLRIRTAGALRVAIDGVPLRWERAKAEELFAYLLLHHKQFVHKEKILEEIWPNIPPKNGLQLLQTAACKIRSLFSPLPDKVRLTYSGNRYCLELDCDDCDFLGLKQALSGFRVEREETWAALEKAADRYGAGFLAEDGYLWSLASEAFFRSGLRERLAAIADCCERAGEVRRAQEALNRLIRLDPADEAISRKLLQLYRQTGDDESARDFFRWLCAKLEEDYDAAPSEALCSILP